METFTKIDHIQSHKTCLNKFQITKIIQSMFSDFNEIKNNEKKINDKKISGIKQYISK